jgi:hypothetical protein
VFVVSSSLPLYSSVSLSLPILYSLSTVVVIVVVAAEVFTAAVVEVSMAAVNRLAVCVRTVAVAKVADFVVAREPLPAPVPQEGCAEAVRA